MERLVQIGKVNLRFNQLPHLLLSIILLSLSPFFLGVKNLDPMKTAKVLEMFVALLGIILLTPIYLPEQSKEIRELVETKYTPMIMVHLIRLLEAVIFLFLFVGVYIVILQRNHCVFPEVNFFLGTVAEAVFLGSLGLFAYSIFDQIAIAYMLPIMYYVLAIGGGKKLLQSFYPFSMMFGSYQEKVYLAVAGVILIIFGLSYPIIAKKLKLLRIRIHLPSY